MLSNSTRKRLFGRKSGTVTLIETKVHRSSTRNAKAAFVLTALIVGLLTAVIAADRVHPIVALFLGAAAGFAAGVVVGLPVLVWPWLRIVWWWLPEITGSSALIYGWMQLVWATTWPVRLVVVAVLVGVPAAFAPVRRFVVAWAWCLIVRHRLRTCFARFIKADQSGTLPLILLARPTPVGERVWIYLRPGLALKDITNRLDKLEVACHAKNVTAIHASDTTAALVRIDIKRRRVLTANVGNPLVDLVDPNTPTLDTTPGDLPTALDLPDVATTVPATSAPREGNGRKPAVNAAKPATGNATADADDINDWI
ncbi:hypothetical protein Val02_14080 [Virgisporangium aliadipatigenens]|uniref:Uncharacterized protein n=1 Tax=Virgisporangium aliadipatigenens TaxID=741659 RepID=A0A8J3YHH2_9ACTN|nr:hypothetical protein Val02_14080 [Virgisporangium aliadipatigenens]